ncbi:MAG TPA: SCP2 sterol-binding domain-containing protein [Acidimicrobiia bacterium]|jgi:hypothetical protein
MAPGTSDDVDQLLARIDAAARALDPADVGGDPITVELTVASSTGTASWFVCLDEHGSRAARGPASAPTVVIHIDDATVADLRSGVLDVPGAIDGGRLSVRGDLGALARARPALRVLAAALATGEHED